MLTCLICQHPILTAKYHSDGTLINLCDTCYEVKFLCDGLQLDCNIEEIERRIHITPSNKINFVRSKIQEVN